MRAADPWADIVVDVALLFAERLIPKKSLPRTWSEVGTGFRKRQKTMRKQNVRSGTDSARADQIRGRALCTSFTYLQST